MLKMLKMRVSYRIEKELKEKIKKNRKYKNLSYFIREAINDFFSQPLSKEEIHRLTEKIKTVNMITTTVLLFERDKKVIEEMLKDTNTFQYDLIYLLTLIIYNYAEKEKLT